MKRRTVEDVRNDLKEKQLTQAIEKQLKRQLLIGMSQGSKAICGVIMDKLKKYDGSNAETVLDDIKQFCTRSLDLPDYKGD